MQLQYLTSCAYRAIGPGKAYTAREQAEMLFELARREPKFISVPVGLMDFIIGAMETIGKVIPSVGVREPPSAAWQLRFSCRSCISSQGCSALI